MGVVFFFFNDTATTEIYTLSLHDALPISRPVRTEPRSSRATDRALSIRSSASSRVSSITGLPSIGRRPVPEATDRSEEHTSELQSRQYLVCRLLLEKKKKREKHYYVV